MNKTEVSFTTDFITTEGLADDALEMSARAGFTHIHWCHHWCDDFIYTEPEIEHIKCSLAKNGLKLSDTHGTHSGSGEKCWYSTNETYRLAGVELVKNRIDFTFKLGGDAVIVHGPNPRQPADGFNAEYKALNKSLDELESYARDRGVKIALENCNSNYENLLLPVILGRPAEYMGFCYDCGHHNQIAPNETPERRLVRDGLRNELSERLVIVHLQDNDGVHDSHWIPFNGEMDWNDVVGFLKLANYKKPLNQEVSYANMSKKKTLTPEEFVAEAYEAGLKLTRMLIDS